MSPHTPEKAKRLLLIHLRLPPHKRSVRWSIEDLPRLCHHCVIAV